MPQPTPARAPGCRVVVSDDNDDARTSLALLLSFEGHQTHEAPNGARAVDVANHVRPDVALIDIGLPDMSGYDVAKRIRTKLNERIVLVAVTGYGQPEDQRRAFDAGFDAHLVKPITVDQLNETFATAIRGAPVAP